MFDEHAEGKQENATLALLHDVVEDTERTVDQVQALFGSAVASGVSALSKNKALPKDQQLKDSLHRIQEYGAAKRA